MSCYKVRYPDRIKADLVLASIRTSDNPTREKTECRSYECLNCKGWHLTSWI